MQNKIDSITLKDIYFGVADGLKESDEENFKNMFYKGNNKYQDLVENKYKFIISGKKGTGKTILARYFEIQQNLKRNFTKMLTDRDVILKEFMEQGKREINQNERELFIEYIILSELGKIIIEHYLRFYNVFNLFRWRKIYKCIKYLKKVAQERICTDNFFSDKYSSSNKFSKSFESKSKFGKGNDDTTKGIEFDGTINKESSIEREYEKNPYYNQLNELRECIKFLLKYRVINLIFDDLDEYDDIIEGNQNFIDFFNAFLKVAARINSDIAYKNKRSRIIVIIRSDMLVPLNESSKNLNKIIADSQIKLNWIEKSYNGKIHPLMELVATKIRNSNKLLENLTNEQIIKRFFPETIKGIKLESYMLNSSFGRPRDIINMLNTIREDNMDANRIKAKMFTTTQKNYSEKFLNELRNEMALHFEAEKISQCFWILEKIHKSEFWLSDIEEVFNSCRDQITKFDTPKEFFELCYNFGIIGNVWTRKKQDKEDNIEDSTENKRKVKKSYSWKYREDGRDIPNENQKFVLHFALTRALIHA